jgi:hypothetical protein
MIKAAVDSKEETRDIQPDVHTGESSDYHQWRRETQTRVCRHLYAGEHTYYRL